MALHPTSPLPAGTALVGKVGIDQTTVGTTNAISVAQIGATTVSTGNGVVGTGVQRVAIASDNTAFSVNAIQATLTKGTQGATGVTTQDLKDAGRVYVNFAGANPVTGVTTEGLISLTPYRDLVAGGAATTHAVTANKRLRLQTLVVTWRNNTAAAGGVTVRLRLLAGTVLVTSPVHVTLNATTSLTTAGSGQTAFINFPDGLELSGTMQLGLTQISVGTVVGFDVNLIGYEY